MINQSVPWPFSTFPLPEGYLPARWGSVVLNTASLPSHRPQSLPRGREQTQAGGLSSRGLIQLRTPTPTAATRPQAAKPRVPAGAEHPQLSHRPPLGYPGCTTPPSGKELLHLLPVKKTSTSKRPACVGSILSPGCSSPQLSTWASSCPGSFRMGLKKCTPDPDAALRESHLPGTDVVPFAGPLLWWFGESG